MECYRTAIQKDPKNSLAYKNLGIIYDDKGQFDDAIEHYLKALAIKPNYVNCHFNLGLAYKSTNRRGKARECFEKCLSIDKNDDRARKELQLL